MNGDGLYWIKAKLKTLIDLRISWPLAWYWQNPYNPSPCLPADEVVIPYLGKMVWVRENWIDKSEFFYEIKDSGGIVVLPEWIEQYFPQESGTRSGRKVSKKCGTWVERVADRVLMLEGIVIIHG
jgi:hypothetical protein